MPKSKEEIAAEKKKKMVRELQRGPDLEKYLEGKKRKYVSYAQGARIYSINYYSFVTLAKKAGANFHIKKKVIIDLELIEKYLEEHCGEENEEDV